MCEIIQSGQNHKVVDPGLKDLKFNLSVCVDLKLLLGFLHDSILGQ